MASFDIVSEVNLQEVDNAVNQARKEITGRFDFKGSDSRIEWDKKSIELIADDEYKMTALKDILQTKMHRRGIDIRSLDFKDVIEAGGQTLKRKVELKRGIDRELAKKIIQAIKDQKFKVQPQIQEDRIRVTSKSIDELQSTIAFIKTQDFGIPLDFENMR